MFKIMAASSLLHSLADLPQNLQAQLEDIVYSVPGLSLNPESVNKAKNVFNHIRSPDFSNKHILLWHDLINNTITPASI